MGLNQALVAHFRFEVCQIRGSIIKCPVRGVFLIRWEFNKDVFDKIKKHRLGGRNAGVPFCALTQKL